MTSKMKMRSIPRFAALCAALAFAPAALAELFWVEAEDASEKTLEGAVAGWGNAEVLSGGKWFFGNIEEGQILEKVPEEGLILKYAFTRAANGKADVWAHIGYEFVRAPFDWRIDQGEWKPNDPKTDYTVGCRPIADWCEVAWCRLGETELAAGEHTLEIRYSRTYRDKEKKQLNRILFGLDCFVVADAGTFRPDGVHRPGVDWRTAADKAAMTKVFALGPASADGRATALKLSGDWEYARWDETEPITVTRTEPVSVLPDLAALPWRAIAVPGNRNDRIPTEAFAHRYLYRTRVSVPADYRDGTLVLDVERANLISSVFLNGILCGTSSAAASGYRVDLTKAMKPGEVNELVVAFKDAYYACEPERPTDDLRNKFNLPLGFLWNQGFTMRFDYPTAGISWTGLFNDVTLFASKAAVTVDDIYAIPSVDEGRLTVEVTVKGPAGRTVAVSGQVEGGLALAAKSVTLGADGQAVAVLASEWKNAELWSPENPRLYTVTVAAAGGGQTSVADAEFGFRQWKVSGTKLLLNGVPWQMRATTDWGGCSAADVPKAFADWKKRGQTMFRMMHQTDWGGVSREQAFSIMDRAGMPVRTEAGLFDGQMALYGLVRDYDGKCEFNRPLLANWKAQVAAGMRRYRNHPCIFAWVLDNEIIFINSRNFGTLKHVEPGFKQVSELIVSMDRQGRPTMTEGGRALMDQSLAVNGCHYEMVAPRLYPDAAYSTNCWAATTHEQPWPMDFTKPIFLNEEYFSPGNPVSYYAEIGGEGCFLGRSMCNPATSLLGRMMSEGFRWQELSGWHFWMGVGNADEDMFIPWQPTCALVRQWDTIFAAGAEVKRTVMVRNDNTFDTAPITLAWAFGGQKGERTLTVRPGTGEIVELTFRAPEADERTTFDFTLSCSRAGKTVFTDAKKCTVLPLEAEKVGFFARWGRKIVLWGTKDSAEYVRIRALGFEPTLVSDFDSLKAAGDFSVLVVGHNTIDESVSTDPRWSDLLAAGRRMIVLEQETNLHYQATPADGEPTTHTGSFAFPQNLKHPVFAGLKSEDFIFWGDDHHVYTNAFTQPTHGADSLVQCGPNLKDCALCVSTSGEGLLVSSQLVVGGKLGTNPVAARLFDNLVRYALGYVPLRRATALWIDDAVKAEAMKRSGVEAKTVGSAADALDAAPGGIVIFDGTAGKLEAFRALGGRLDKFFAAGGYLIPWNVGEADLAAFNALAGTDFILRPFRRERVEIPVPRDPVLSGLSQRDVTVFSGERVFGWVSDCFVADDVFSGVVDAEDIGPFLSGWGIPGKGQERQPGSIVNGFLSPEAWRYIVYHEYKEGDPLPVFKWELPRTETLAQFSIAPNGHYRGLHEIELVFDGKETRRFTLAKYDRDGGGRQDFELLPPVTAKTLELRALDLVEVGDNRTVTGIDNIWLKAKRSDEWKKKVIPLLNVGGLVLLPREKGGILLNQVLLKKHEEVPENGPKKMNIVLSLMKNLGAVFASARELKPGEGLVYSPVTFEGLANMYLSSEKGFYMKENDLSLLPCGEQKFAGVTYGIRDFRTSPLEAALVLKLGGKPDRVTIPVAKKADALFFLQAHAPTPNTWTPRGDEQPPEMYVYDIVYDDGSKVSFAQRYGVETAPWLTDRKPHGISKGALAWTAPAREAGKHAQLFSVQWNNPTPEKPIKEVVLRLGRHGDWFGQPILLGVTAAELKGN